MTKGWYGNRQAHSLASKGIKTSGINNFSIQREKMFKHQVKTMYGFEDMGGMLNARTNSTSDIPSIAEAIRLIEGYNDFYGEDVANKLHELHERGVIMGVSFGREGSPVMYVEIPYWTNQVSNYDDGDTKNIRRLTEKERNEMKNIVKNSGSELKADEIFEDTDMSIRLWWD